MSDSWSMSEFTGCGSFGHSWARIAGDDKRLECTLCGDERDVVTMDSPKMDIAARLQETATEERGPLFESWAAAAVDTILANLPGTSSQRRRQDDSWTVTVYDGRGRVVVFASDGTWAQPGTEGGSWTSTTASNPAEVGRSIVEWALDLDRPVTYPEKQ